MTPTATRLCPAVVGVFLCVFLLGPPIAHGASLYNVVPYYTNDSCVLRSPRSASVIVADTCTADTFSTRILMSEPVTGTCLTTCTSSGPSTTTVGCGTCSVSGSSYIKYNCNSTHASTFLCTDKNCTTCPTPVFTYVLQTSCPTPLTTTTAIAAPCKYVETSSFTVNCSAAQLYSKSSSQCDKCNGASSYVNCSFGDSSALTANTTATKPFRVQSYTSADCSGATFSDDRYSVGQCALSNGRYKKLSAAVSGSTCYKRCSDSATGVCGLCTRVSTTGAYMMVCNTTHATYNACLSPTCAAGTCNALAGYQYPLTGACTAATTAGASLFGCDYAPLTTYGASDLTCSDDFTSTTDAGVCGVCLPNGTNAIYGSTFITCGAADVVGVSLVAGLMTVLLTAVLLA